MSSAKQISSSFLSYDSLECSERGRMQLDPGQGVTWLAFSSVLDSPWNLRYQASTVHISLGILGLPNSHQNTPFSSVLSTLGLFRPKVPSSGMLQPCLSPPHSINLHSLIVLITITTYLTKTKYKSVLVNFSHYYHNILDKSNSREG